MATRERTKRRQLERTSKASSEQTARFPVRVIMFGLLLVIGTVVLYSPVQSHEFINWDDDGYVTNNPHIQTGLTWQTIRWSLTATEQANWHPVTWISHALDYQMFGADPAGHHIGNVLIHAANALLLFLLLYWATNAEACSFLVAALFAVHPLNVESVAWVAERKNVLSTLFFLLTLGAYGWYARQPTARRMARVVLLFVLALAAKPMVVTLPFVLLLLDYWPLRRISGWIEPSPQQPIPQQPILRLLLEKWPLLILAAASCVITVIAQKLGGAVRPLQLFSFSTRLGNAVYSYAIYLGKTFWPSGLAIFYPHPGNSLSVWKIIAAAIFLIAISIAVWMQRAARPHLLVGWLWFCGTLVPVIGIIQVGDQAMADRYAYVPLIGIFVMVIWSVAGVLDLFHVAATPRWVGAITVLAILSFLTLRQLSYWENSLSVWSRAQNVTSENPMLERKIATALVASGDVEDAISHLVTITRIYPADVMTHVNLGAYYAQRNRMPEATQEFETAVTLTDHGDLSAEDRSQRCSALINLGFAYTLAKDYPRALEKFRSANQADPAMTAQMTDRIGNSLAGAPSELSYIRLALLLEGSGQRTEAAEILEDAIKGHPAYRDAHDVSQYLTTQK